MCKYYKSLSKSSLSASLVQVSLSDKSKSSRRLCRQHGPWNSSVSSQCSYSSLWCSRSISDGKSVSHALQLLENIKKLRELLKVVRNIGSFTRALQPWIIYAWERFLVVTNLFLEFYVSSKRHQTWRGSLMWALFVFSFSWQLWIILWIQNRMRDCLLFKDRLLPWEC